MKRKVIPTITGEFLSLAQLAEQSKTPKTTLYYHQSNFRILPFFLFAGETFKRFKFAESIIIMDKFRTLSQTKSLAAAAAEIKSDIDYVKLLKLANRHNREVRESINF